MFRMFRMFFATLLEYKNIVFAIKETKAAAKHNQEMGLYY